MSSVPDQYAKMLFEIAEARRLGGGSDRVGYVWDVQKDKVMVCLGLKPDGSPWLSPWLHTTNQRAGARERRFFKKGQNVRVSAPGGDYRQATVTAWAESQQYPAPDHADAAGQESETYQLQSLRVTKVDGVYDIWIGQQAQGQGLASHGTSLVADGLSEAAAMIGAVAGVLRDMLTGSGGSVEYFSSTMQSLLASLSRLQSELPDEVLEASAAYLGWPELLGTDMTIRDLLGVLIADLMASITALPSAAPTITATDYMSSAQIAALVANASVTSGIMSGLMVISGALRAGMAALTNGMSVLDPTQLLSEVAEPDLASIVNGGVLSVATVASQAQTAVNALNANNSQAALFGMLNAIISGKVGIVNALTGVIGGVNGLSGYLGQLVGGDVSGVAGLLATNAVGGVSGMVSAMTNLISALSSLVGVGSNLTGTVGGLQTILGTMTGLNLGGLTGQLSAAMSSLGGMGSLLSAAGGQFGAAASLLGAAPQAKSSTGSAYGPAAMKLRINKDGWVTGRVGNVRFAAHKKGVKIKTDEDWVVIDKEQKKIIMSKPPVIDKDPIPDDNAVFILPIVWYIIKLCLIYGGSSWLMSITSSLTT